MPNRSTRDVRQNVTPMVRPTQPMPVRPAASPVMAQPMSRPTGIVGPKPGIVAAAPLRGRQPVSQAGAGQVPQRAAIAAGVQAPALVANQPRMPAPTVTGPVGPAPADAQVAN